MQIAHAHACILQEIRQILRHLFRERRDQNLISFFRFFIDLGKQVVDLSFYRTDGNFRIQKPCRADDLLGAEELMLRLILTGRCRNEKHLVDLAFELLKLQRTVVQRRRKAEAEVHQGLLSRTVSVIHRSDLRDRHMRLVHNDQKVVFIKVDQGRRRNTRRKPCQMAGVVFNTGANARLPHHFHIKIGAL